MNAGPIPETRTVHVELGPRSYDIVIGSGLLDVDALPLGRTRASSALVVTNEIVAPLWAGRVERLLGREFANVSTLVLPDGEAHKNWGAVERIVDALLSAGADRDALLFALGGGVVGDVTGFAAACYMRGISFVQLPTTLLAQVDASVGGKTAINHPRGKNMIGAFHQPRLVVADLDTLDTLPKREFVAGLAEVIKSALVADADFLEWIDANLDSLLARDKNALAHAVETSCRIKASIVGEDERESGLREVLNFGHTFGHAIETGTGYGAWLHGEAVGCGMLMAVEASRLAGLIEEQQAQRIIELVKRAGLPTRAPRLGAERYLDLMRLDKKARKGEIRLILLTGRGEARVQRVDEELLRAVIRAYEE